MTDRPGLPLTTGEGNTAERRVREMLVALQLELPSAVWDDVYERTNALSVECGRLREQLDALERQRWSNENRAEVAERGHKAARARDFEQRDTIKALREQLDAARREVDSQMQSKLDAQVTLKAVTEALNLRFDELGDGWREAAPKILARIETIVDEADRAFRERDAARAALGVEG